MTRFFVAIYLGLWQGVASFPGICHPGAFGCAVCGEGGKCRSCEGNYALGADGTCIKCHDECAGLGCKGVAKDDCCKGKNCQQCANKDTCTMCKQGYFLQDGYCQSCHEDCSTQGSSCFGPSEKDCCNRNCQSCTKARNCNFCSSGDTPLAKGNCPSCASGASGCLVCDKDVCVLCDLMNGYAHHPTDGTCIKCHSDCCSAGCKGPGKDDCCTSDGGHCLKCLEPSHCTKCDSGYFKDTTEGKHACKKCHPERNCDSCYGPGIRDCCDESCLECSDADTCLVCKGGATPQKGSCPKCVPGLKGCLLCSKDQNECITCDVSNNFAMSPSGEICKLCPSTCEAKETGCQAKGENACCEIANCEQCPNVKKCSKCWPGYVLDTKNNKCSVCHSNCEGRCYGVGKNECCPTNCLTCTSSKICTSCIEGSTPHDGLCPLCEKGMNGCTSCDEDDECTFCDSSNRRSFHLKTGVCEECHVKCRWSGCLPSGKCCKTKNCQSCTEDAKNCKICFPGYYVNLNANKCIKCNPSCKGACFGPSEKDCCLDTCSYCYAKNDCNGMLIELMDKPPPGAPKPKPEPKSQVASQMSTQMATQMAVNSAAAAERKAKAEAEARKKRSKPTFRDRRWKKVEAKYKKRKARKEWLKSPHYLPREKRRMKKEKEAAAAAAAAARGTK